MAGDLNTESIAQIAFEFWGTMTSLPLQQVPVLPARALPEEGVEGRIEIQGAWSGAVELRASRLLAAGTAASLLSKPVDEVTIEESFDAIQEATNIVAGGVKRLMPPICKMTIPKMTGCTELLPPRLLPAAILALFTSSEGNLSVLVAPES